jgi:Ca2+ transporting ATPase
VKTLPRIFSFKKTKMVYFAKSVKDCLADLATTEKGISSDLAAKLTEKYGVNELPATEKESLLDQILAQFQDSLVIILLLSAVVSFVLSIFEGFSVEPFVILLILVVNAVVAITQETNAENAINALKEYYSDEAKVLRDGAIVKIPAKQLVPGDIVSLSVGDKVPADCRVIKLVTNEFKADQSILTGEAFSVPKDTNVVPDPNSVIQDQANMVFSGTCITVGKALCCVCYTGSNTAIGKIHASISEEEDEKTPLKIQLDEFGDQLAKIISVICILVWLINVRHFNDPAHGGWLKGSVYYFKIAVALAVAAIPEGLAVIITTCLALGTQKMAKEGAIVRKLRSVETLGCCSIICSDKTGTLTTNQMSVRKVFTFGPKGFEADISGDTYGPEGTVSVGGKLNPDLVSKDKALESLITVCATCNESKVTYDENLDSYQRIGEPTEAALYSLVEKMGTADKAFNSSIHKVSDAVELANLTKEQKKKRCSAVNNYILAKYSKLQVFEFSRDRKSMSVLVKNNATGETLLQCKGAPESVLERCSEVMIGDKLEPLTEANRKAIAEKAFRWGEESALRVLAFAVKKDPKLPAKIESSKFQEYESKMCFVGLVAMMDPPRHEVKDAINKCEAAGIRVVMITGDNQKTAESVCRQIGLFGPKESTDGLSFTGKQFDSLSEKQKIEAVRHARVFSRTEPTHKSQLVDLYKSQGYIVAMVFLYLF